MKKLFALLALVVVIGSGLCGHSLMKVMAGEQKSSSLNRYYTSIQIMKGDSLWSIAGRYAGEGNMTTSEYVEELKRMNSLGEDTIRSGQYLTIVYFTK